MICSLSGEIAKEPVVSPKSGAIFERSLIEKYIASSGTDPITDEILSAEDLIALNVSSSTSSSIVPPKPPQFSSIPAMLSSFQNEWDSLALEVFTLRKQLHKARQELSAALYHHDAAVRVASRAIKERDEAQHALQELSIAIGTSGQAQDQEPVSEATTETEAPSGGQIPVDIITNARTELFQLHKSLKPKAPVPTEQEFSIKLNRNIGHPFKKATSSYYQASTRKLLVGSSTGAIALVSLKNGDDNEIIKYSKSAHKGMDVTSTSVVAYQDLEEPIASHLNGEVIIGNNATKFPHNQKKTVSSIITHPSIQSLFIIVYEDGSWTLNNSKESKTLYQATASGSTSVKASDIHVDGALLALGSSSGEVQIYDLATGASISSLKTKYSEISKIKFALNGYWLLVSSSETPTGAGKENIETANGTLEVFDLRTTSSIHAIDFAASAIQDFIIDPSSSLVVTLDSNSTLSLHKYTKKGKSWSNNVVSEKIESPIHSLQISTNAEDDDFKNGIVKFVTIGQNSSISEYQLS